LTRYRSILAATCGLAVLAVAGCTENPPASTLPPPATTPTTTPRATPSQTPKPQPPVMPAAAREQTTAGVEAFVRHWMATSDYMAKTGDTRPFVDLNTAACEWCADLVTIDRDLYEVGGYRLGDLDAHISAFHLTKLLSGSKASVQYRAQLPEHSEVPKPGASPTVNAAAVMDYTLNLAYSSGQWKVATASWQEVSGG